MLGKLWTNSQGLGSSAGCTTSSATTLDEILCPLGLHFSSKVSASWGTPGNNSQLLGIPVSWLRAHLSSLTCKMEGRTNSLLLALL
jgi:hypothetical protein